MIHEGISVGRKSHDAIGEEYLKKLGFPATVYRLVGGHVIAKRSDTLATLYPENREAANIGPDI